jgi:hypothetical protein
MWDPGNDGAFASTGSSLTEGAKLITISEQAA